MFVDRDRDRDVAHLHWRVRLFGAGAIFALAGIYADVSWMVWLAIAILFGGFLLRFVPAAEGEMEGGEREDGGPA